MTISNERLRSIWRDEKRATWAEAQDMAGRVLDLQERELTHAREWRDSVLLHEQKWDEATRMRDNLERRAENAEAEVERLKSAVNTARTLRCRNADYFEPRDICDCCSMVCDILDPVGNERTSDTSGEGQT